MESNKENVKEDISKIPLPVNPVTVPPRHRTKLPGKRRPLTTLMRTNSNQNLQAKPKEKTCLKLDTRYVTIRSKQGESSSRNVFEDNIIYISDDEDEDDDDDDKVECKFDNAKNSLEVHRPTNTPALQNKRVKNIKKSLKRPSSRELIGLDPGANERRYGRVSRQLNFNEGLEERLQSSDQLKRTYMVCCQNYTGDVFTHMLSVERKPLGIPNAPSLTRACVINWLIKVNGADGNPAILQTACWFLDSILGIYDVHIREFQLVAAACYWIAQKLHGPAPPSTADKLVKCSNKAFTIENLNDAEKAVLKKLRYPAQPVVPQDYINYLSMWCDSEEGGKVEVAATFLCMSGLMVNKVLCGELPSVIAAASVRNALLLLGKRGLILKLQSSHIYKEALKKTANLSAISSVIRKSVLVIWAPLYEYKALLDHYGAPPHLIAQRIITAASELSVCDAIERRCSFEGAQHKCT